MQFNDFMRQLTTTNATLDYFVDFNKVSRNVDKVAIKLNQLNYLIGKENIAQAVHQLYKENKSCFSALRILIAVRKNKKIITSNHEIKALNDYFSNEKMIIEYINKTGLAEVFKNKKVTNLVDYVFGVEVGLDSNARKNRGGKNMERLISSIFNQNKIAFQSEVKSTHFPEITSLGKDIKRFDFVIKTDLTTYLIEVNYYNSGGSKLNEIARAYMDISPKINQYDNFEFVWITDGKGWYSAKNKLNQAFNTIPNLYNLTTLKDFTSLIQQELE